MISRIKIAVKIAFVAIALWWVYSQIDFEKALDLVLQANIWYLIAAFIALFLAQVASALRTRYYFRMINENWSSYFTIVFYLVGMFINNVLPSSIGGDGYKIYFLKKNKDIPAKTSLKLIISERANGLYMLLSLSIFISLYSNLNLLIPYFYLLALLAFILITLGYFISINIFLKEHPMTAIKAFSYSIFVQGLNFVCFTLILMSLQFSFDKFSDIADYNVLFLFSSVAAILPISIGGAGVREVTFLYGSELLSLDIEIGVASAFLFFAITTICTSTGAPFLHRLEKIYKKQNLK